MGQRQQGLSLEISFPLSAFTQGTSVELMMPHEDERNVPEENMISSKEAAIKSNYSYFWVHFFPSVER